MNVCLMFQCINNLLSGLTDQETFVNSDWGKNVSCP